MGENNISSIEALIMIDMPHLQHLGLGKDDLKSRTTAYGEGDYLGRHNGTPSASSPSVPPSLYS
jgi:hypothetical protein